MNEWIASMWEALYNPIFLINGKRGYVTIYDGQHRFRLLNAMRAESLYIYELMTDLPNTGDLCLPVEIEAKIRRNDRTPMNRVVIARCQHCKREAYWRMEKRGRVDWTLKCQSCGYKRPYPWSGEI